MIVSFKNKETEELFRSGRSRRWKAISAIALRKLDMLDAATTLEDLRSPPGNRLKALQGNRKGTWSIRINDQWQVCFRWQEGAQDVEIVDYH